MDNFIENLKNNVDAFECENLRADTNFSALKTWDSLALLSLMATISSCYGVCLTNAQIISCKTIEALYEKVCAK